MENLKLSKIKISRINHVGIPITDRKKTLPFYRDILGLKIIPSQVDSENVIWTQLEDGSMIHPIETNDPEGGASHVAFQVKNFSEAIQKLNELNIPIESGPGERYDGQKFLFIRDPDGNRIEITSENNLKKNNRSTDEWGYTSKR
tara:strand:+ start:1623 stop:2057 length:435 start_codon:yes stop_codon:yes gene_type:complete